MLKKVLSPIGKFLSKESPQHRISVHFKGADGRWDSLEGRLQQRIKISTKKHYVKLYFLQGSNTLREIRVNKAFFDETLRPELESGKPYNLSFFADLALNGRHIEVRVEAWSCFASKATRSASGATNITV